MSTLNEQDLRDVLQRAVPDPHDVPGRVAMVRRRAGGLRRRRRITAGAAAVAAAAAAALAVPAGLLPSRGAHSAGLADGVPAGLRRPLALPTLTAGDTCPVSTSHRFPAGGGFSAPFTAVGSGPVFLTSSGTVKVAIPPPPGSAYAGSAWPGQKVIWAVAGSYRGPLLLRGAQLDGDHQLRFDRYLGAVGSAGGAGDGKPYRELAYPAVGPAGQTPAAVRTYPSAVRVQAPGCYGIQVDGTGFSTTIVFIVQRDGRPSVVTVNPTDRAPANALLVLDDIAWLLPAPAGSAPSVRQAQAEAVYRRESVYARRAPQPPHKTILAVAHTGPNHPDRLVWAIGADQSQRARQGNIDGAGGEVWKSCSQLFLVDAQTGSQIADYGICPSILTDWFPPAGSSTQPPQ